MLTRRSRKCFQAKAYRATVAMCGVTLEGACELEGARKAKLQEMLEEMKNKEKIDNRLWEWAESLRHVRNSASHFNNETVTRQDADDSLAFSEALLDYLYVLAKRFEAMKQRRPSSKQASPKGRPRARADRDDVVLVRLNLSWSVLVLGELATNKFHATDAERNATDF